jgi:hypothetical protein
MHKTYTPYQDAQKMLKKEAFRALIVQRKLDGRSAN